MRRAAKAPRRQEIVALALLASCGGTTGFEHLVRDGDPPAPQVDSAPAPDESGDPSAPVTFDTGPLDATVDDRRVPERPPARETGAPPASDSSRPAADAAQQPDGPAPTTLSVLAAQSPGCLRMEPSDAADEDGNATHRLVLAGCAATSGCLEPTQQGGVCELTGGLVPDGLGDGAVPADPTSPGYAANCLQTLQDIFASHCADSTRGETPCLCGYLDTAATSACLQGITPPTGPLVADYLRSFAPQAKNVVPEIENHFQNQTYGAGQANALVQCLTQFNCLCCLGGDGGCTD